jgi:hypothetical protein
VPPAPSPDAPVPYSFAGDFPPIAPPAPLDVPPAPASFTDIPETLASTASSTADVSMAPPPHAAPAPPRLGQAASLPPLADAFAALLAAEQDEPLAANVPSWPAAPATAAAVDDALVEDITRRVLERLSDQVVRETVGEIVSRVAEQLVRQEIERIKAQLR